MIQNSKMVQLLSMLLSMILLSLACNINVNPEDVSLVLTEAVKVVEDVSEEAEDFLEENKPRIEIISRATEWVVNEVPYGSFDDDPDNNEYKGYRADCSGLVSYAWQLNKSETTDTLSHHATDISVEDLKPGDILNNKRSLAEGHVVIFVSWVDMINKTTFIAIEENYGYGKAVQTTLTLQKIETGAFTIKEYNNDAPGPYYAQRLNTLP